MRRLSGETREGEGERVGPKGVEGRGEGVGEKGNGVEGGMREGGGGGEGGEEWVHNEGRRVEQSYK